tara:strand:- start:2560 stop:3588 length:1029 start_codon:yes stop_codon:yes gene_type:complete
MKILFIGKKKGNSYLTYKAVKKKFVKTEFLDTSKIIKSRYLYYIFYHFYPQIFNFIISNFYKKKIIKKYDIIFLFNTEFVNSKLIEIIKKFNSKSLYYCCDNPWVNRDKKRWKLLIKQIHNFDLIIFHQFNRLKYIKNLNIKDYLVVPPQYFENIQVKRELVKKKDVVFVGTWFPERGKFFYELKKKGLNVNIYGTRWNKDKKYYKYLKDNIKLKHFYPSEVSKIVGNSKINIALFSEENNDDITRRSIEIAASGSMICSKRTNTMKKIFKENKEAVYFNNAKECYFKCMKLLKDIRKIDKIAKKSHLKITKKLNLEASNVFQKIIQEKLLEKDKKHSYFFD